jgi:hypothetical protein
MGELDLVNIFWEFFPERMWEMKIKLRFGSLGCLFLLRPPRIYSILLFFQSKSIIKIPSGIIGNLSLGYDSRHSPRHDFTINSTNKCFYWDAVRDAVGYLYFGKFDSSEISRKFCCGAMQYTHRCSGRFKRGGGQGSDLQGARRASIMSLVR